MGLFARLFGSKRKVLQQAMKGVDMVRIGLMYHVMPECESNFGEEYASPLAAAIVNTVFCEEPSNEVGREFIANEKNRANALFVVKKSIVPDQQLRQLITDAVRIQATASHGRNPSLSESDFSRLCEQPIDNLRRLNLLEPGGNMPDLHLFLGNAGNFIQACKAAYDAYQSDNPAKQTEA